MPKLHRYVYVECHLAGDNEEKALTQGRFLDNQTQTNSEQENRTDRAKAMSPSINMDARKVSACAIHTKWSGPKYFTIHGRRHVRGRCSIRHTNTSGWYK